MSNNAPLISIVSPVYCEEENIQIYYEEVCRITMGADFEIELLFVDDGSTDESPHILHRMVDNDPRVKVITFSKNFGAIPAYTAGVVNASGDAVVLMSVDLQDPPSLISDLVSEWEKGNDIVWAVRDARDDPLLKTIFARLFYGIVRLFAFAEYPQHGTDTCLISRRVADIYKSLPERDSSPFFTLFSYGFRQARIPYKRRARERGTSGWPFWRRVKNATDVITSFSYLPIRLISTIGFLFAGLALLSGIVIVYRAVVLDLGSEGWPSVMVLVLFVAGVQMLFIGILAEYIWRIAEQTRQRPRYIISDKRGGDNSPKNASRVLDPLNIDVSDGFGDRS